MHIVYALVVLATVWYLPVNGQSCPTGTQVPSSINVTDSYPFVEGGLQIFTQIVVPCNGKVTHWSFLVGNRFVTQLHLAIFRPLDGNLYQLVGDTYLQLQVVTPASNGWTTIPATTTINVQAGDVVGMYYDNKNMLSSMAAIQSKRIDKADPNYLTLVWLQGISDIQKVQGIEDAATASKQYRIPALVAILNMPTVRPTVKPQPYQNTGEQPATTQPTTSRRRPRPTTKTTTTTQAWPTLQWDNFETTTRQVVQSPPLGCAQPSSTPDNCPNQAMRYYYDQGSQACVAFFGCPEYSAFGSNNFATIAECNRCKAARVALTPSFFGNNFGNNNNAGPFQLPFQIPNNIFLPQFNPQ